MRWLSGLKIHLHYPAEHRADNTASFAFRASIFSNDNAASLLCGCGKDKQAIFNMHAGLQRLIINLKLIFDKYQ